MPLGCLLETHKTITRVLVFALIVATGLSAGHTGFQQSCRAEGSDKHQTCSNPDPFSSIPPDPAPMLRQKFVLFGDSLTQQSFDAGGWGARLASLYQRKADITLRGYSGYNTRWALQTLEHNFPVGQGAPTYDFATVWFGANDAALPDRYNARQSVPILEYKKNLGLIVDRLQKLGAAVILITPPPVDEQARVKLALQEGQPESTAQAERTLAAAKQYAEAAKEVADEHSLPVLDLWTKLQEKPNWRSFLTDGLHFNPAGNEAVFELLVQKINESVPQIREDKLMPDFPWNMDIRSEDFLASFDEHARKQK